MNKLVIVGNGFDKAHGLPTSYCEFINDFWKNFPERYLDPEISEMVYLNPSHNGVLNYLKKTECFLDFQSNLQQYSSDYQYQYKSSTSECNTGSPMSPGVSVFKFNNHFLKIISSRTTVKNWVDIENIYYELLLQTVKQEHNYYPNNIERLNIEFKQVKDALERYLIQEVETKFRFVVERNDNRILEYFKLEWKQLEDNSDDPIFLEFPKECHDHLLAFDRVYKKACDQNRVDLFERNCPDILFLNFNYTNSVQPYVDAINKSPIALYGQKASQIQIHGKLGSRDNPINFGFGDEMDDHYKMIEKKGENAYLENIKSFQYLHNSNYRRLLNWVEAEPFQIYIFGHSCGLSDRTMLNTIFEHEHCKSIKLYYYKDGEWDNFTELTQNISRQFDNKRKMRSKIVDRSISDPLDQSIRFFEKPKKES